MRQYYYTLFLLCVLVTACQTHSSRATKENLYYFEKLDSTLKQSEHNIAIFENKIAELEQKCANVQSTDAVYFYQKLLTEAFIEADTDSALSYISKNLELAKKEQRLEWEVECYIYQAQAYTSTGLINKTREALDKVRQLPMSREMKLNYYVEEMDYWSNRAVLLNAPTPAPNTVLYADSILKLEPSADSPYHMYAKTWYVTNEKEKKNLQQELMAYADEMSPDNIWYDKITLCTGVISFINQDVDNEIKYYVLHLISKYNKVSRHLPHLASIGSLARNLGELNYAAQFYNYAITIQADHPEYVYNGRGGLGNAIMKFHNEVTTRLEEENHIITWLNMGVMALMLLSTALLFYTFFQLREKNSLNKELKDSNQKLSESEQKLRSTNDSLSVKEKELSHLNHQLQEANYLKEEYIGQLFATCSEYLGKVETLKKSVNRKLRAGQYAEATKQTDSTDVRDNEDLRELWKKFDDVFLKLFPNFIEQFNGLLRPEEQITLRSGEKLNTDLRIYALVRLGINSSVKIGKILGISSQTVYNARMKMRSRATESQLEFPERVRLLKGKNPPPPPADEAVKDY